MRRSAQAWNRSVLWALALAGLALVMILQLSSQEDAPSRATQSSPAVGNRKVPLARQAGSDASETQQEWTNVFQALRSSRPVPPEILPRLQPALGPNARVLELDFEHAYFLETDPPIGIWVLDGKGVTCLFDGQTFAMACDNSANTARDGLIVVSGRSPMKYKNPVVTAVGIAPDGARAVRFGVLDSPDRVIPVRGNAFAFRTRQPIVVKDVLRDSRRPGLIGP
jgi:hypothetical protein